MRVDRKYMSALFAVLLITVLVYELDRSFSRGSLDARGLEARRILNAFEVPDQPAWAGSYYVPGAHSADFILHLNRAGFLVGNGLPADYRDFQGEPSPEGPLGTVAERPDGTLLLQERLVIPRLGSLPGRTHIMNLVRWDTRVYAVTNRQMPRFIREVNAGLGPKGWDQGVRLPYRITGKESVGYLERKFSKTPPSLPPPHRDELLAKPIMAAITFVGPTTYRSHDRMGARVTRVAVSAGRDRTLRPGMSLYARNHGGPVQILLDRVGATNSEGDYIVMEYREPLELVRFPYQGQRLTNYSEWLDEWVP